MKNAIFFLIALLITSFIGYIIESLKIKYSIYNLNLVNKELISELSNVIDKENKVDMFLINRIRNLIKLEFFNKKIIDKYDIYKLDNNNICVKFYKNKVIDNLNIYICEGLFDVSEISILCEDEDQDKLIEN